MEKEMNIQIFIRSVEGMELTMEGVQFLNKAKLIIDQYHSLLHIHSDQDNSKQNSIVLSTIRSSLVMESFIRLIEIYYDSSYEFTINEHNGYILVHDITYLKADLGVIYIHKQNKSKMMEYFTQNAIRYEKTCDFNNCIIFGVHHPLANKESVTLEELKDYGIVVYSNDSLPYQKHQDTAD